MVLNNEDKLKCFNVTNSKDENVVVSFRYQKKSKIIKKKVFYFDRTLEVYIFK